jgi:hypothetical protein
VESVCAQTNLPACTGSDVAHWSFCLGSRTLANGNKYVGQFMGGKVNGQGTKNFANGNKYIGEFRDGKANGQGIGISARGDKYVGAFQLSEHCCSTFLNTQRWIGRLRLIGAN